MGRALLPIAFACAFVLGSAGCTSIRQGLAAKTTSVEPGTTTRDQLYRQIGLPDDVAMRPNGTATLVYRTVRIQGLGAGVSVLLTPFELGNRRAALDSVFVDLSRDDVVIGVRSGGGVDPGWSIWPWGDGSDGS